MNDESGDNDSEVYDDESEDELSVHSNCHNHRTVDTENGAISADDEYDDTQLL